MSIDNFLSTISKHGGLSSSNNFEVQFNLPKGLPGEKSFRNLVIQEKLFGSDAEITDYFKLFCDEAQLPNINSATGQQNGLYLGIGSVDYVHTRIFTELSLSFMLDANQTALKFFNMYHSYIFGDKIKSEGPNQFLTSNRKASNRVNRLEYKDDYACDLLITKTEMGPLETTQRKPITYVLEKAFPYSIDAVPLQYGSTQFARVNVQFKYERYYTINRDIKSIKGDAAAGFNKYIKSPAAKFVPGAQRPVVVGSKSKQSDLPIGANDIPSNSGVA